MPGSSATQPEHTGGTESPTPQPSGPSRQIRAAVGLTIVWYVCLVSLIVFSETPVAVNRRQIEESSFVVAGDVAADGAVTVRIVLKGVAPGDDLRLVQPLTFPAGDWILPLSRVGRRFEVTPTRLPNQARLVYPVTDEAIAQIAALVE